MLARLGLATVAAFSFCSIAQAADLRRAAPPAPPVPVVAAYNWTGFYIGGNLGYGSGDLNATAWGVGASASIDGWFVGGQMGWNWQAVGSPWVWGVEVDSQWANIGNDVTVTGGAVGNAIATVFTDLDYFGTARLRLGYAWDRLMFYGTGGLAWGSNSIGTNVALNGLTGGVDSSNTHVGWTIGAGLEWALIDNWTAKVEYLYVALGNENYFPNRLNGLGFDADIDIHTIKVGLNYRFGYGKYPTAPVVARY